jgi:hypothetical protein
MGNPYLAVVLEELNRAGVHHPEIANGGKHLQVRWKTPGGQPRMCTVSYSPTGSDRHAAENMRRSVRQTLRADGMLATPEPRTPPARQPSKLELLERRVALIEQQLSILKGA